MLGPANGGMRIGRMNIHGLGKHLRPVLLLAALAIFFYGLGEFSQAAAQRLKDLPPPPSPPRLKPTPTPTRSRRRKRGRRRDSRNSNLVMVPVSVVDATGQPWWFASHRFSCGGTGREHTLTDLGNPDQVPLISPFSSISSSVIQKGFFNFSSERRQLF